MRTIACKVITTQNERKIPVANGYTQAAWTAENGAYTESNPTFTQTSIDAFKMTDLIKVSDELLSDSFFDIEGYISEEFGRAFGEAEEAAFINGAVQTGQTAIDRPYWPVHPFCRWWCSYRRNRSFRYGNYRR